MTPGLIERLEAAGGPGIVLEAEIFWTLERDRATTAFWRGAMGRPGSLPEEFARLPRGLGMASMEAASPNYTASLDAALALAERVLDSKSALHLLADLLSYEAAQSDFDLIKTDDLPRLLCIAILKARATQEQG